MSAGGIDPDPPPATPETPRLRRPGLSAQVFLGFALGIFAGVFFGERAAAMQIVGEVFIGLLQMTVLPYVLISLVAGLGRLSYPEVRLLALRGGGFVLLFWGMGLAVVGAFGASFPDWESATFFSSSLVETGDATDLVRLYVPANPFFALSNSVVPAVVVFGLALGLAVIGVPGKGGFIADLDVLGGAIFRIAGFVARLAPLGVFALIAAAAGTLDLEALGRLQVYILTYVGAALLLSLWMLPALVGALTPLSPRRVLSETQDALVTAFATGSLLIVLPLLTERIKGLLEEAAIRGADAESAVDLVVPINFNLPNLGKLLSLAFVPFAGWFAGTALGLGQYPLLLGTGLVSLFGEVVVALPFLLDVVRVPADLFELFLAVDVFTGRFGTLLAGVHTVALALLTAAAVSGALRLRWGALLRYAGVSAALFGGLFLGLRVFFEVVVPHQYQDYEKLVRMQLLVNRVPARTTSLEEATPAPRSVSRLDFVRERGSLRVGYLPDGLPFAFRNEDGREVGLDVDLAHLLAGELGVDLEFTRVGRDEFAASLAEGRIDLAMGGLLVTPERALGVHFTPPYLATTLGLVVRDYERDRFDTNEKLRAMKSLRVAAVDLPYYQRFVRQHLPQADVVTLESPRQFFRTGGEGYDALLYTAQAGSAWTLIYPRFSVVVPKPRTVEAPIAFALPRKATRLQDYVDTWLRLQVDAGVVDRLHAHWILGEGASRRGPRWSIARDVLGWFD